ncbi:hypothetical protein NUW58_g10781 [Xylaria curta]|uniref:Uncharacterized protein n=1 Tax=Xylaria curta TaxID=42375 RepID=A0ACC1MGQ7_9PEZI|nr:hypothetical protein NUW58_g10781 [Xylaria curta]
MAFFSNVKRLHRNNVATIRSSPLAEVSGALGDLGTLLPLMITLAVNRSISLSTTLVFSGFFNIATGVLLLQQRLSPRALLSAKLWPLAV